MHIKIKTFTDMAKGCRAVQVVQNDVSQKVRQQMPGNCNLRSLRRRSASYAWNFSSKGARNRHYGSGRDGFSGRDGLDPHCSGTFLNQFVRTVFLSMDFWSRAQKKG
jgi:hypothetical protein